MSHSDSEPCDLRGLWVWRFLQRWEALTCSVSTCTSYALARLWNVQIGPGCIFYGRTHFSRAYQSRIQIGRDCAFRSGKTSNKAGLNRSCMISTLAPDAEVRLGDRVRMSGTVIGAARSVNIGNAVLCGANVTITDTDWHGIPIEKRSESGETAPVLIGDHVWLGLNVVVLKGVTIGRGSVIGAGSIVTKSVPEGVVAAGQPARVVRTL